ncbi:hypothetical protein QLX08_002526 [Tetragonisca angustula]|uniref:Uncharacterized protein n=1 Tax=Tetragonisca angustula TaxID=166442 RepID=A0AAW1AAT3_9HYME
MILILADRLEPSLPQIPGRGLLVQLRLPGQVRAVSGLGQEAARLASGVKSVSLELLHFSSSTELLDA